MRILKLSIGIFLLLVQTVYAGNKMVTRKYEWKISSIPGFDVHYYGKAGENTLPYAEKYLRKAYERASNILPEIPKESMPFFLYNNHNDFEESNITDIGEGTGGVTEAAKNRFLVGNTGSQRELEYVISHEYIHEVEFEYLFSGFWRSIRLLKFIVYPNWLLEGLAEYSAGDLDSTTREMYLRDAATRHKLLPLDHLHSFNHVMPHQMTLAYKESEALMRYIAEEYGQDKLPRLLKSYRDKYDSNSVLMDVLGTDFDALDKRFREYMEDKYSTASAGLKEPSEYGIKVTAKGAYPRFCESAVFSPDGKTIAYISDGSGRRQVYIKDISTGKTECVSGTEKTIRIENISTEGNGLSFSADGKTLVFCGERLQRDRVYFYGTDTRRLTVVDPLTDTASSPVLSPDGRTVYFSGMKDGSKNIYSLDIENKVLTALTTGFFEKTDPAISPDGTKLVFSEEKLDPAGRPEYDIYVMELTENKYFRVTSFSGDERYPCYSPDGEWIYFTSDMDGVNDIYRLRVPGGNCERLTNVIGGNFQPVVSRDGKSLMFSSFRDGERHLYIAGLDTLKPLEMPRALEEVKPADNVSLSTLSVMRQGDPKPYSFRASTDFFFPVILYSSLDGFYTAFFWQASDLLGDHNIQTIASYASGFEYLDYQVAYSFLRYRPKFYFNFTGNEFFVDRDETDKKIETSQAAGVEYPLNRFQRLQLQFTTVDRKEIWKTALFNASVRSRENIAGLAFIHDTVAGPYLEATSGGRFMVQSEFSGEVCGGNYVYQNYMAEANKLFPLGRENVLGLRLLAGASYGRDAGYFRLGGSDRVRAIPESSAYYGKRLFVTNLEWRLPLSRNINYHMWYMFPDFFFKTFYASLFVDGGVVFNESTEAADITLDRWKGSYGISFKFHTFIIETYDLPLNFQFAQRMDQAGWVFYLSAGSAF